MKSIFLFVIITFSVTTKAQVTKVSLQASGLTCSMCSNAINKSLKTLEFVIDVAADIKTYTFEISFKPNSTVDFDKIKRKVENAGFTVCSFVATINFNNVEVKNSQPVTIGENSFFFVNVKAQSLNGPKLVKVVDKGYVSSKEYKSNTYSILSRTYHATI